MKRYLVCSLFAGLTSASVHAASVVTVTGTISRYDFGLSGWFSVGQPYSLSFTWEGLGIDVAPNPATGSYYPHAGENLTFNTGNYTVAAPEVAYEFFPGNGFSIVSTVWLSSTIPGTSLTGTMPLSDRNPYLVALDFSGHPDTLDPAPSWATMPSSRLTVGFATSVTSDVAFGAAFASGTVDMISSVSVVPEPATLALYLAGVSAILRALAKLPRSHQPRSAG
jgi:hypothetical protein